MRLSVPFAVIGLAAVTFAVVAASAGELASSRSFSDPAAVVLEDLRFTPNRLDAKAGVPLTVRLTNAGTERHDFDIESLHMPGYAGIESILQPGETRSVTLEFDQPGTHTFTCSLPGHAAAGMTGAVFVTQ